MNSFGFEYPYLLLLIPFFIICFLKCKAKESAIIFPHLNILKKAGSKKRFLLDFLKLTSVFLLVVALAMPIKIDKSVEIKNYGYDIALAIDASGSMKERGFDPSNPLMDKFNVVKTLIKDFIKKRENDNISLVVFGSFAYTASPLTFNKKVLKKIVDYLNIGIAGQKTAIFDAIAQGVSLLKKGDAKSKILILLTDGIDTASQIPLDVVLRMAKKYNIKIYTIGIGSKRDINMFLLNKIAKESGGKFYFAKNANDLKKVYEDINRLEKSKIRGKDFVKKEQLYPYVLFLSIMFLLFYIYLYGRRGV
ncbi:vWA domain-containing protein [Nitrosophilus kaiyonis]|uniref:vWA domain-containing protein n=1 Tax=Nitrosophilus kaiyonis TaxID=2930200 RepID=UPI00248FE16D|nr:VWA domain-containing protein [Nitrosophilus kaiyonis]